MNNFKQNQKIAQVKNCTLVVGIDIGSTKHFARALTGVAQNLGKFAYSATAEKASMRYLPGCSA